MLNRAVTKHHSRTVYASDSRKHPSDASSTPLLKVQALCGAKIEVRTDNGLSRITEWARKYGGLYSLKLGSGTAIIITDRQLVKQLVDRKAIYNTRPVSHVSKLITGNDHVLTMEYGELWRQYRKLIHQFFMESMVETRHTALVHAEGVQMTRDFLLEPDKYTFHLKRYSNSIIMSCC